MSAPLLPDHGLGRDPLTPAEAYATVLGDITAILRELREKGASPRKVGKRDAMSRIVATQRVGDLVAARALAMLAAEQRAEPAEPAEPAVAGPVEEPMRPGAVILITYDDVIAPLQRTSCPDAGCATHHERPWVGVGGLWRFTWAEITAPPVPTITILHPGLDR